MPLTIIELWEISRTANTPRLISKTVPSGAGQVNCNPQKMLTNPPSRVDLDPWWAVHCRGKRVRLRHRNRGGRPKEYDLEGAASDPGNRGIALGHVAGGVASRRGP